MENPENTIIIGFPPKFVCDEIAQRVEGDEVHLTIWGHYEGGQVLGIIKNVGVNESPAPPSRK